MTQANNYLDRVKHTLAIRGEEYDKDDKEQERSMALIVKIYNLLTEHELSEADGWEFMSILKKVRQYQAKNFHEDSALDDIAYTALAAEAMWKEQEDILEEITGKK